MTVHILHPFPCVWQQVWQQFSYLAQEPRATPRRYPSCAIGLWPKSDPKNSFRTASSPGRIPLFKHRPMFFISRMRALSLAHGLGARL